MRNPLVRRPAIASLRRMDPVAQGWLEIVVGMVFCYVGYSAARVVIAMWGAGIGGVTGAVALAAVTERIPSLGALDWLPYVVVIGMALVGAGLSFAFYGAGVLIALGSLGWWLGTVLSTAMGLASTTAMGVSVLVAGLVIMAGWVLELPRLLLIVITALVGATAIISGLGRVISAQVDWFDVQGWTAQPWLHVAWLSGFLLLTVSGVLVQRKAKSERTLRAAYQR